MSKEHVLFFLGSVVGTIIIFGLLEFEQLKASFDAPISNILIWGLTEGGIGVGQELVYRGLLYTTLTSYFSNNVSALITTFLFIIAPLHSVRMWELLQQVEHIVVVILILVYAAAGFFFQWLRNKSHSIILPAVAHGIGNGITWLTVFF